MIATRTGDFWSDMTAEEREHWRRRDYPRPDHVESSDREDVIDDGEDGDGPAPSVDDDSSVDGVKDLSDGHDTTTRWSAWGETSGYLFPHSTKQGVRSHGR
jgi:hypothetical protein